MHEIKWTNFRKAHPGEVLPGHRPLTTMEMSKLRARLGAAAGVKHTEDVLRFTVDILGEMRLVTGLDANSPGFDLGKALERAGIQPADTLFINWYRFDCIDEFASNDVVRYFSDLWYPSSDDIDVFDAKCNWLVSVGHNGSVSARVFHK